MTQRARGNMSVTWLCPPRSSKTILRLMLSLPTGQSPLVSVVLLGAILESPWRVTAGHRENRSERTFRRTRPGCSGDLIALVRSTCSPPHFVTDLLNRPSRQLWLDARAKLFQRQDARKFQAFAVRRIAVAFCSVLL